MDAIRAHNPDFAGSIPVSATLRKPKSLSGAFESPLWPRTKVTACRLGNPDCRYVALGSIRISVVAAQQPPNLLARVQVLHPGLDDRWCNRQHKGL